VWCSPTSTSMVLGYWGDNAPDCSTRVQAAVKGVYDWLYDGHGNWPFNTAYAATRTDDAFVTRLRNLREARSFIEAGIPLVASISFGPGQLSGAPIGSTNGHLLVIVGFTASGDVIVNDPAARTRAGVRRTYDRGQFENAWLKRFPSGGTMRGSGGLAYVIRDAAHPLPARAGSTSW